MMIEESIYLILILLVIGISYGILINYLKQKKREFFIKNFADYMATLEFFEEKAYDIIYKDQLLIYSIEATKIDDKKFGAISKDFSRLVLKLLGPSLQKEYEIVFGLNSLFLNTMEYFNKRYEDDEIRKESINNLMTKDIEDK